MWKQIQKCYFVRYDPDKNRWTPDLQRLNQLFTDPTVRDERGSELERIVEQLNKIHNIPTPIGDKLLRELDNYLAHITELDDYTKGRLDQMWRTIVKTIVFCTNEFTVQVTSNKSK